VALLLVGTAWLVWRTPRIGFAGFAFFLLLAPSSSIVPIGDLAAEHRMYLPLAVLIAAVTTGGVWQFHRWIDRRQVPQRSATWVAWTVVGAAVAALAFTTFLRNQDYASGVHIWSDVVAKAPQNPRGPANLGIFLAEEGRHAEAIEAYRRSLALDPRQSKTMHNLGLSLVYLGQYEDAARWFADAHATDHGRIDSLLNLGVVRERQGRPEEAIATYRQALEQAPGYIDARFNLANALASAGDRDGAIREYREVLRLAPNHVPARENLDRILRRSTSGDAR
jgi:tetratricopeptide (TPR) repeat protein